MSDNFEPFATAGSGKSAEEVAFDLVSKLKGQGVWGERNRKDILDMYAECLDATRGLRAYPGQSRVEVPIKTSATSAVPAQTAAATANSIPAPQQAVPQPQAQMPAHPAPVMQPVQAQQMQVQQAFKQS